MTLFQNDDYEHEIKGILTNSGMYFSTEGHVSDPIASSLDEAAALIKVVLSPFARIAQYYENGRFNYAVYIKDRLVYRVPGPCVVWYGNDKKEKRE